MVSHYVDIVYEQRGMQPHTQATWELGRRKVQSFLPNALFGYKAKSHWMWS